MEFKIYETKSNNHFNQNNIGNDQDHYDDDDDDDTYTLYI